MSYTLKEYRIPMPMSVDEYQIAQLYMTAKASERESGKNGEGVEILKNEPYVDEQTGQRGQYTHKKIHLSDRLPSWAKTVMPSLKSLSMEEQAWNAYPYCKTVYHCDFFKDKLTLEITTMHAPDNGTTDNIHKLSKDELKKRKVDVIDIAAEHLPAKLYKRDEDPTLYHSQKTNRGPLKPDWYMRQHTPTMTCYKLVKVGFKVFGLQGKVEKYVHDHAIREQFVLLNRQAFCWTDDWWGMTMKDIRLMEQQTAAKLSAIFGTTSVPVPLSGDIPVLSPRFTSTPRDQRRALSMSDATSGQTAQTTDGKPPQRPDMDDQGTARCFPALLHHRVPSATAQPMSPASLATTSRLSTISTTSLDNHHSYNPTATPSNHNRSHTALQ